MTNPDRREPAKHQWQGSQCRVCGAFRRNHAPDSDCFVQNLNDNKCDKCGATWSANEKLLCPVCNDHVGWAIFMGSGIEAADKNDEGAFKVYRHPPEAEKKYNELVDALCSPSWLGRLRHSSVVGLAKRLRDSQDKISP